MHRRMRPMVPRGDAPSVLAFGDAAESPRRQNCPWRKVRSDGKVPAPRSRRARASIFLQERSQWADPEVEAIRQAIIQTATHAPLALMGATRAIS